MPAVHLGLGRRGDELNKFLKHLFNVAKELEYQGSDGTFASWVCARRVELSTRLVRARSQLIIDRAQQLKNDYDTYRRTGRLGWRLDRRRGGGRRVRRRTA